MWDLSSSHGGNVSLANASARRNVWKKLAIDYFNNINNWTLLNKDGTTSTSPTVSNNQLHIPSTTTQDQYLLFNNLNLNDGRAQFIWENPIQGNVGWVGHLLRANTNTDFISVILDTAANATSGMYGHCKVYQMKNGTYTSVQSVDLNTVDVSVNTGIPIAFEVEIIGETIKAYVNGNLVMTCVASNISNYLYGPVGIAAIAGYAFDLSNYSVKSKEFQYVPSTIKNVVCIGSSITYGTGSSTNGPTTSWATLFGLKLTSYALRPVTLINKGVSGDTTTQMLARFTNDVIANNPDLVVIESSVNDVRLDQLPINWNTTIGNLRKMIKLTKQAGAVPMLTTPTPITNYQTGNTGSTFGLTSSQANYLYVVRVRQLALEEEVFLIDNNEAFSNNTLLLRSGDGVHPNDSGCQIMVNTAFNTILGKV